jgi:hypothetical protein
VDPITELRRANPGVVLLVSGVNLSHMSLKRTANGGTSEIMDKLK